MEKTLHILIVGDSQDDITLIWEEFERSSYEPIFKRVETPATMAAALEKKTWDLVIAFHFAHNLRIFEALELTLKEGLGLPFIIIADKTGEETAVAAMKAGACDYVLKDNMIRLIPAIERELNEAKVKRRYLQAEKALSKSEEKYCILVENIHDGVFLIQDEKIQFANEAFARMAGYPVEEITGMDYREFVVHEDLEVIANLHQRRLAGKKVTDDYEIRALRKDGTRLTVNLNVGQITYHNKIATIGVVKDITKAKQADKMLRESEARNQALLYAIPDFIFRVDKKGTFLDFKASKEEVPWVPPSEFLGKTVYEVLPELAPQIMYYVKQALETKETQIFEYQLESDSSNGYYEARFVVNGGDEIIVIVRNITECKLSEDLLLENERLAAASKAKSEFLAIMSHELRTPLNSIMGFASLLKDEKPGDLNEEQELFVGNILTSSKHLLSIINDTLDISKIEAGKVELVIENIPLPGVLQEVHGLIKEDAKRNNVIYMEKIDPQLKFLEADRQRLKQIFFNLFSNAIKFNKPEGGTVTLTAAKEGNMARFSVSDTGIGIMGADIPKLFNQFQQANPGTSRKYGGTGLGLAITKQLVELHGGTITVESEYGKGSIFTFSLPLK